MFKITESKKRNTWNGKIVFLYVSCLLSSSWRMVEDCWMRSKIVSEKCIILTWEIIEKSSIESSIEYIRSFFENNSRRISIWSDIWVCSSVIHICFFFIIENISVVAGLLFISVIIHRISVRILARRDLDPLLHFITVWK